VFVTVQRSDLASVDHQRTMAFHTLDRILLHLDSQLHSLGTSCRPPRPLAVCPSAPIAFPHGKRAQPGLSKPATRRWLSDFKSVLNLQGQPVNPFIFLSNEYIRVRGRSYCISSSFEFDRCPITVLYSRASCFS